MSKYAAKGTTIGKGDAASPEVFTTIAQVISVDGPDGSREAIDVTDHGNTDGFREFVAGLADGGEVSFEMHYDQNLATQDESTGLVKEFIDGSKKNYRITWPDSSKVTFAAIITALSVAAPVEGKLTASCSMKISGKPTWA